MHTDIEPLEATWTPIGANRNSFAYVAKSLNLEEIEKGCSEKMKRCIEHVKSQGKSEESAAKICNTQIKDSYVYDLMDNKIMEVIKMIEDLEKKEEIKEKSESLDSTPDIEKQKEKDEAEEEKKKDKKKKEEEEKKKSLTEEDVKKILDERLKDREGLLKAMRENISDVQKTEIEKASIEGALTKRFGGAQ